MSMILPRSVVCLVAVLISCTDNMPACPALWENEHHEAAWDAERDSFAPVWVI